MSETVLENKMLDLSYEVRSLVSLFLFELEEAIENGEIDSEGFDKALGVNNKIVALESSMQTRLENILKLFPSILEAMQYVYDDLKEERLSRIHGINSVSMSLADFVRYLNGVLGFIEEDNTGEIDEF